MARMLEGGENPCYVARRLVRTAAEDIGKIYLKENWIILWPWLQKIKTEYWIKKKWIPNLYIMDFDWGVLLLLFTNVFRLVFTSWLLWKCHNILYSGLLQLFFHHHHHVVPQARISLTLSRHFSLSFIASGRSSGLHPISSHSCWIYVRAGRPAFAWPYVGVHRSTSLMSSSLILQQWPTCMVHLTWIVFVMGGRWLYSWCLVGCCHQDLFNIAHNIFV